MTVQIHKGDCLEIMPSIPNKSVDMILCDLPYGATQNKADKRISFDLLWKQYKRIIKDNGCIALFAQGKFCVDLVNSNKRMFRYDLVWNKGLTTGFLNAKRMPLRQHEQIAIFYKKLPTYNPQFTQGQPQHSKGTAYKTKELRNDNYGKYDAIEDTRKGATEKYPISILQFVKPHPSKARHRTEKPVALLEYLIKTYTNEGDTVLDNCMGGGNTGVACVNTNRNFIGIEKQDNYFEIAEQRIQNSRSTVPCEASHEIEPLKNQINIFDILGSNQ